MEVIKEHQIALVNPANLGVKFVQGLLLVSAPAVEM
jgi:hypothetical protein